MNNISEALLLEYFRRDLLFFEAVHRRRRVVIMEVHENVEGNVFNAYNASNAFDVTIAMEDDLSQPAQIESIKVERNLLINLKALKATTRPKATQKRLVKKEKMKVWKQVIIQEVK